MFNFNTQERKILLAVVFFFFFSLLVGRLWREKTVLLPVVKTSAEISPVDINSADFNQLVNVPGIGPVLAEKIISRRKEKEFRSLEELKQIKGIKDKKFKKIKPYLRLD